MQATDKPARNSQAGRVGRWTAVAVMAVAAAGLAGCVTAPYPGYGGGYGPGYAAGSSTAYGSGYGGTTVSGQPYNSGYGSGYDSGYNNGYGSGYGNPGNPGTPQPYPAYSSPSYSQYPTDSGAYNGAPAYQAPADNRYGVVDRIEMVPVQGSPTGVGAVLGGVVGGLVGHQIGGGRGNTVATIGGAVAGALAGNAIEGNTVAGQAYRVVLRLNDNSVTTLTQSNPNGLRAGDRARIENGVAVPY